MSSNIALAKNPNCCKTKSLNIALAGNPNCGKTTLFNEITGSKQHVGNWPGVTVEKKEGKYKKNKAMNIVDLPGIYSLSPYSAEEIVARNYIVEEKPDVLINIIDATNIERNMYLTLQILETEIPTIVALNMMDEVENSGTQIDIDKISKLLGVKVVPIVARNGKNIDLLMEEVKKTSNEKNKDLKIYSKDVEEFLEEILCHIDDNDSRLINYRWRSIKLLEEDSIESEKLPQYKKEEIQSILSRANEKLNGDAEGEIADQRYKFISSVVGKTVKKKEKLDGKRIETTSDKIDKILTNRLIAIPAFLAIMYGLFSITFGEGPLGIGVWLQTIVVDFWDGPLTETILTSLQNMGASEWTLSLVGDGI